jgi:proteasome component ECM29
MEMIMSAKDSLIKEACFVALGQLCMFGAYVPENDTVRQAIDKIHEVAKTGNEQATLCLGQVSMVLDEDEGDAKDSNLTYVIEQLHKLHEVRQAEVHFGVGEAFSYVASGWRSSALAAKLDIEGPMPNGPKRQTTLEKLADRFISDCAQTKPSLKKAAAMWLLCLVQFCGEEQEIQSRLGPIQVAFKRCLTDRDELVQETASRGLGLVYEKGDRSLKDDLVRDLVSSFSSDKSTGLAGTVSADTQLFEPGALPTGDGSVSTYKDIMSLASEVGDSSLVYRFMSMASSNAIWSSRAAFGRFGLSNVLSDSSVDGYLAENPKLYPKLFRYRFDPNQGVQRSMNDIWNALVKDSSATIDKHFDAIIEDLLTSILGKEWRTRQASCAAIADLVSGRPMEKYEPYLERIWNSCFKVLDDIKESVRAAAASLARTLTGILTRALEADHSSTKTASSMLKHVLPFLLSPSGMESSAKEVQAFAVRTLLAIIKKSNGQTLRPFIPELVERLVGLLSSLEPEAVNYIHLNASKYNLTEQKIDDMRLSSVRSSPIMEAIERCLDLVDDETMKELQPRLANAMKSAVGLPSKVGSSRILVSLSTRRMAVFKPVADDFMKLIEKLVLDRNETVASSYAASAGYVARHASDKQILKMVAFAKGLYFDSEHDRERRR